MLNLQFAIKDSGRILLHSDGITKVLHPFEAAADALVHRACTMGATDDVTALLVLVEEIWE